LGLPDLEPDPSLLCTDLDSSISKQKKVRKTLIFTIFLKLLFDFLYTKTKVNVPSKSNKEKTVKKTLYFVGILSATDEKAGSGSAPYQNVTDLQH
jgi:hypothetical protein